MTIYTGDVAGTIGTILGFIGTTGLTLYISLKDMVKKVAEKIKKKFHPKSNDETKTDAPARKESTMVVVVEEIIDHEPDNLTHIEHEIEDVHDLELHPGTKIVVHEQESSFSSADDLKKLQQTMKRKLPRLE